MEKMTDATKEIKMSTVHPKVKEVIVEQLGVDAERVKPEASFIDDLGADSLDIVELVMAMEEEFGVEIPDEDAEKLKTVADVSNYLQAKGKA
jgi:acyl carrier protein